MMQKCIKFACTVFISSGIAETQFGWDG